MLDRRLVLFASAVLVGACQGAPVPAETGGQRPFEGGDRRPFKGDDPAPSPGGDQRYWRHEVRQAGASYIALHFKEFELAPDAVLRVSDARGGQAYELRGKGKMQAGTFWAQHIKGEAAVLELNAPTGSRRSPFVIDEFVAGTGVVATEAICGADDKRPAVCYRESNPMEYTRGRAVARLLSSGSGFCTGWLVGPDNLLITNNHCINTAEAARDTDYEFAGETAECSATAAAPSKIFSGGELLATDADLDFTLIRLTGGNPAAEFGYLEIDNRKAEVGEQIYIPGHPGGRLKEITIASTHPSDAGGLARVSSVTEPPCSGSGFNDVGYYGDTEGGNSGSPVLATASHKVIALHHCANCPNRGVPIDLVYAKIQEHLVTSKGALGASTASASCTGTVELLLRDRDLATAQAQTVTFSTDAGDREEVSLAASGAGVFRGRVTLVAGAPVAGDGVFQVAAGARVELRYEDANVGDGTAGVSVAGLTVDCTAPVLSDVSATARAYGATISARTDEPATLRVRHGVRCDALDAMAEGASGTTHAVELSGLRPGTTYFFAVEAADAAGNGARDDNAGACHSLTTALAPDTFFVEEFAGATDLSNSSVTLTPVAGPNAYAGCRGAITALPTDPAAGTTLTLGDDESVEVRPSRPVRLFGRTLDSLWVGSNGYVSAERDTGWSPTASAHFSRARVAGLFDDLSPQRGGRVSWQELADRVAVTWFETPSYSGGGKNTFQVELFFEGAIRLSWLTIEATGVLVGVSEGGGAPMGYRPTDFSASPACQ